MKLERKILELDLHNKESSTELNQLLDLAQSDFSFFGKRIITILGYEGSISLDTAAKKILSSIDEAKRSLKKDYNTELYRTKNEEFAPIIEKMKAIYDKSYAQKPTGLGAFFAYFRNLNLWCCWTCGPLSPYHQIDDLYMSGSRPIYLQQYERYPI